MSENAFDAVVIGSGLGGLTAAALLAKAGRKVCVIERNHSVGGAASAFKKGALTIEPALHQTADPHYPGDPKHAILKELGLLDEIEWIPISPFFSVKGGPIGEIFDLPVGFDAAHHALSRRFPKSSDGFARLLGAMEHIHRGVARPQKAGEERSIGKLLRAGIELRPLVHDWRASTAEILRALPRRRRGGQIRDRRQPRLLRRRSAPPGLAVLRHGAGRVPQGGRRVHQGRLARPVDEARQGRDQGGRIGAARPRGGRRSTSTARAIRPSCATSTRRTKADEQRVGAKQVFANCAPHVLAPMLPDAERAKIERAYLGTAAVDLAVLGAFRPQRPAGETRPRPLRRQRAARLDDVAQRDRRKRAAVLRRSGRPAAVYGHRQLRRDRQRARRRRADSGHASSALDRFDNWAALSPQEEKDRRERWLDAFQAALDRDYPGFSAAVVERMFLNARSMHNFMNTPDGAIYGFAPLPFERGIWAGVPRSPRTPLPGVYLASSFAEAGGFTGAMRSGAEAARMAMKERAR